MNFLVHNTQTTADNIALNFLLYFSSLTGRVNNSAVPRYFYFVYFSEDSVYQTYFHSKWCSDSLLNLNYQKEKTYLENTLIEEFFKNSTDNLLNHLQLINLPLLESIALMHTLKKYNNTNILEEFHSMKCHPVPIGRDACIWFSTGK